MNRLLIAVLTVLALSACGTPPPVPDDHYYRLAQQAPAVRHPQPPLAGQLLVAEPVAAGVRRGRKMLYSDDPQHLRFQQYHYHHWEDAIPHLVQRWLIHRLVAGNVAENVLSRPNGRNGLRLASRIHRFERLIDGDRYSVVVAIEFELTREPGGAVFSHILESRVNAAGSSMEATVVAFSSALDQVGGQLDQQLAGQAEG